MSGKKGQPRPTNDLKAFARQYTDAAIKAVVEIMQDEDVSPGIRIKAAALILDRGFGKAAPAVEELPEGTPQTVILRAFTMEEIESERAKRKDGKS